MPHRHLFRGLARASRPIIVIDAGVDPAYGPDCVVLSKWSVKFWDLTPQAAAELEVLARGDAMAASATRRAMDAISRAMLERMEREYMDAFASIRPRGTGLSVADVLRASPDWRDVKP